MRGIAIFALVLLLVVYVHCVSDQDKLFRALLDSMEDTSRSKKQEMSESNTGDSKCLRCLKNCSYAADGLALCQSNCMSSACLFDVGRGSASELSDSLAKRYRKENLVHALQDLLDE